MHPIPRHKRHESIIVSGGFPCQDASKGNPNGKGIYGSRTGGGWAEMLRIIREVKPEYVFLENVPNLLRRGWGHVLADLSTNGYHVWWRVIPAKAFGYPFEGERVYAVAFKATHFGWKEIQSFYRSVEKALQGEKTQHHPAGNPGGTFWSATYSEFLRVDNGLPSGAYRIAALGNACIPLFPEIILRVLNDFDNQFFHPRPA